MGHHLRVARHRKPDNLYSCLNPKELLAYWQAMSFRLTDAHLQGLKLFFQLAVKHQFLETLPELNFFAPPFPLTGSR